MRSRRPERCAPLADGTAGGSHAGGQLPGAAVRPTTISTARRRQLENGEDVLGDGAGLDADVVDRGEQQDGADGDRQ